MTIDKQVHFPSASTSSPLYPHPIAGETHMRPDRINIGDGLLLRWSTKEDEANVADLMANVFMVSTMIECCSPLSVTLNMTFNH